MKTLAEHEAEARAIHERMRDADNPHANGIACPECGGELWDSNPTFVLDSCPPRKEIHCPACGYRGCRTDM